MNALSAAPQNPPYSQLRTRDQYANGKSVIVRVNDRGPFHGNRVIDVSKAAAQQLGFINQGTAHVKVEQIVPGQSTQVYDGKDIFVDLKSFGTEREAQAYMNQAARNLSAGMMNPRVSLEKRDYEYVVKMGPFTSQERAAEAEAKARGLIQAASLSL